MKLNDFLTAPAHMHLDESTTAANTTSGVDNPSPQPLKVKRGNAFGYTYVEVDDDTYHKFTQGKQPFKRWVKYVEDENLRDEIKKDFQRNKRLLVKSTGTGRMSFIK